jgi:hypothetical protein
MAKHSTKKSPRQDLAVVNTAANVRIPLPLLSVLEDAESAFFGLCVATGKQVLEAMMQQDRIALCGPAGRHDPERQALRGGSTESAIVLGGCRIGMRRLRARSRDREEFRLPSFEAAARRHPLDRHTLEAIASGVTMRRYARSLEPLPADEPERSTSRSAVSRRFVALTQRRLAEVFSKPLDGLALRVVMIDGIAFRDHCVLLALGVASDGEKHVLGLWEGSTEHSSVAKALLRDLIERGLPTDRALLFVVDGSKALRKGAPRRVRRTGPRAAMPDPQGAQRSRASAPGAAAERAASPAAGLGLLPGGPGPSSDWSGSPLRSTPSIPVPRHRSGRAWRRRSPS